MSENVKPIYYQTSPDVQVKIGDLVESKVWFIFKWKGQVSYVPGESQFHKKMEVNGLHFIGWRTDKGHFVSTLIDPDTQKVIRLKFLGRGVCPDGGTKPDDIVEEVYEPDP